MVMVVGADARARICLVKDANCGIYFYNADDGKWEV